MRKIVKIFCLAALALVLQKTVAQQPRQTDHRPTIAVPIAKSDVKSHQNYLFPVTQKITEMLRSSKRFIVVSRTDEDVMAERDFQKSEEFLDRQLEAKSLDELTDIAGDVEKVITIEQNKLQSGDVVFLGAKYILLTEVRKLDVVRIRNHDNTVAGYKALMGIQLSVNNTETNTISHAKGFESLPITTPMFSPQRAVDEAIISLDNRLKFYFMRAFPLSCAIVKTIGKQVMIDVGSNQGVSEGQRFTVYYEDGFGDEKFDVEIGEIRITNVSSANFSQCNMVKGRNDILKHFSQADKIKCVLQQ